MKVTFLPNMIQSGEVHKTHEEDFSLLDLYEFFQYLEQDPGNIDHTVKERTPMFSLHDIKDETHFLSENVKLVHGMVLDIDGYVIDAFCKTWKKHFPDVAMLLYTTHSHKDVMFEHRFRAVAEFKEALTVGEYRSFVAGFKHEHFGDFEEDRSSFDFARRFYFPAAGGRIEYHEGQKLDTQKLINIGVQQTELLRIRLEESRKNFKKRTSKSDDKKFFEASINKVSHEFASGNRDTWLSRRLYFLRQNGCDRFLALELLSPFLDQINDDPRMKSKFRKLINEL